MRLYTARVMVNPWQNTLINSQKSLSIKEILLNIYYSRLMDKLYIIDILTKLIFYFDKKYNNNIDEIINNILKRINIFSSGYIILDFLAEKINRNEIENKDKNIFYNLLLISLLCCNHFFINNNNTYVIENNIDYIMQKYNDFLSKNIKKPENNALNKQSENNNSNKQSFKKTKL